MSAGAVFTVADVAAEHGISAAPLFGEGKWASQAQILRDGELVDHVWKFAVSPMMTALLPGARLTGGLFPSLGGRLIGYGMHHDAELRLERMAAEGALQAPAEGRRIEGLHVLVGGHHDNLWHFLFNFLLRLCAVEDSPRSPWRGARLAVLAELKPSFLDFFDALGFEPGRFTRVGRRESPVFEALAVSELPVFRPPGRPRGTPEAVELMRARLPRPSGQGRRLYLTRRDARWRKVLNEAELIPLLEERGFEVVEQSRLGAAELIALMGEAEAVVGASGANLGATLFCPNGATVIELSYEPYVSNYYFQGASALCGLRHFKLQGQAAPSDHPWHQWDFQASASGLAELLDLAGLA